MQDKKNRDFLQPVVLIKVPCVLMPADIFFFFLPMHTWRLLKEEKEELSCTQIRAVKLFILTGTEEG